MAYLDQLLTRFYAAEPTVGRVSDDTPVALRIKDVANGTSTPTVVFTDTFSDLTITDSDGNISTWDLSAAAYDTMGELVDAINATAGFEAKLLDCLRSDSSNDAFVLANVTQTVVDGETVFDCKLDTDVVDAKTGDAQMTYRVTYDRSVSNYKPKGSHRIKISKITYNVGVSGVEGDGVKIYKWDAKNRTEELIWTAASVVSTLTTHSFAEFLSAGEGNDLIVRVADTTSITDAATNFLQIEFTKE